MKKNVAAFSFIQNRQQYLTALFKKKNIWQNLQFYILLIYLII